MTQLVRTLLPCWSAALLLLGAACDNSEPSGPDDAFREGETATFKTANTDLSFKWRGCEPPWGPDPYYKESTEPTEKWTAGVLERMQHDLGAQALGAWLDDGGAAACEEGCASLDLAWTGGATMPEPRAGIGKVRGLGQCDEKSVAWSIDVEVSSAVDCACG